MEHWSGEFCAFMRMSTRGATGYDRLGFQLGLVDGGRRTTGTETPATKALYGLMIFPGGVVRLGG